MKVKVEWQDGQVWRSVLTNLTVSRRGNFTFRHDGKVYVFKEKREGSEVMVQAMNGWQKAGRVTRGTVFLGLGISSEEYYRTPKGMKEAKEALQNFLACRQDRRALGAEET